MHRRKESVVRVYASMRDKAAVSLLNAFDWAWRSAQKVCMRAVTVTDQPYFFKKMQLATLNLSLQRIGRLGGG